MTGANDSYERRAAFASMKTPQTTILSWIAILRPKNVWIVGGGSGHGFKHGPVIGEMVADAALGLKLPPTEMALGRLLKANLR